MNNVNEIYDYFSKKERKSNIIFISLNLIAFGLAALLVILNLFAIRFNPVKLSPSSGDDIVVWMFVAMSIITGIIASVSSVMSFFVFRKRALKYKDKKELILKEQVAYDNKEGSYEGKNRDKVLVEAVTKIINN